jgi:hypothetical protein
MKTTNKTISRVAEKGIFKTPFSATRSQHLFRKGKQSDF